MNREIYKILRKAKISKWLSEDEAYILLITWNDKVFEIFKWNLKNSVKTWAINESDYKKAIELISEIKTWVQWAQKVFIEEASQANNKCKEEFIEDKSAELKSEINQLDNINQQLDNYLNTK